MTRTMRRLARIAFMAFEKEEEGYEQAARMEGMTLSAWIRRACDRAMQAEERARKIQEKWY